MNQRNQKSDLNNSTNIMSSSNQQDALLNMNQNQSVMDRLLPSVHSSLINSFNRNEEQGNSLSIKSNQLNNGLINFPNSSSNASSSNWSNLTNNLANNLSNNLSNNNNFANLAGYNSSQLSSFTQQQMNLLLNQNGKHSPIPNLSVQQQQQFISNNYNDFPLLQ